LPTIGYAKGQFEPKDRRILSIEEDQQSGRERCPKYEIRERVKKAQAPGGHLWAPRSRGTLKKRETLQQH